MNAAPAGAQPITPPHSEAAAPATLPTPSSACARTLDFREGAYSNPEDVISQALEMLQSEDEWLQDQKCEISAKIDHAFEQFERGEGLSPEQLRAEMEKRKAQWLADRRP